MKPEPTLFAKIVEFLHADRKRMLQCVTRKILRAKNQGYISEDIIESEIRRANKIPEVELVRETSTITFPATFESFKACYVPMLASAEERARHYWDAVAGMNATAKEINHGRDIEITFAALVKTLKTPRVSESAPQYAVAEDIHATCP